MPCTKKTKEEDKGLLPFIKSPNELLLPDTGQEPMLLDHFSFYPDGEARANRMLAVHFEMHAKEGRDPYRQKVFQDLARLEFKDRKPRAEYSTRDGKRIRGRRIQNVLRSRQAIMQLQYWKEMQRQYMTARKQTTKIDVVERILDRYDIE